MTAGPALAQDKLKVLATFSILGDFVKNVGGDRVEVATLVGPNSDAHVYAPAPADAKKVADAKVVIVNGLGYEGWMSRLAKASGSKAPVVVASKGVKERKAPGGHGHGGADPHAWQSVANAKIYVANIRDALDCGRSGRQGRLRGERRRLSRQARRARSGREGDGRRHPADRRKIISTHDAFGYFQQAYGVEFMPRRACRPRPSPPPATLRASSRR